MSGNINVSWKEVEGLVADLAEKMVAIDFKPDVVIGILRGGVVPARLLCNYFDKAMLYTVVAKLYDDAQNAGQVMVGELHIPIDKCKNIVVVDDISHSGKTFKAVLEAMCNKYSLSHDDGRLRAASLYVREKSSFVPIFYGEKVDHENWFDFPWEKKT